MYPLMPCIFYIVNMYHIVIKLSYIKILRCRGVPWLGFQAFNVIAWVQSLVRELRFHKPHGTAKKKKKKYKEVKNKLEVIREKSTGEKELKVKTVSFPSFFFFLCKIWLEFFSLEDQCSSLYEGDGWSRRYEGHKRN